ncbi:hypothetical protein LOTGIDRAFT_176657 [Lottia gigantea]|uniref:Uncharacterized protein n=1 Tax=Lottia gigantea TaxID=225164 RepID=V3ZWJ8_LOTGI|nr:hypothetical protein LOTGIDRAFT_176657 [Lottia gigantea]ESO95868.1 hypothetical protein LOTGIDRAFT_176657 [Lottia gigantea]
MGLNRFKRTLDVEAACISETLVEDSPDDDGVIELEGNDGSSAIQSIVKRCEEIRSSQEQGDTDSNTNSDESDVEPDDPDYQPESDSMSYSDDNDIDEPTRNDPNVDGPDVLDAIPGPFVADVAIPVVSDHVILVPNVTDVDVSSQPVDVIPVIDVIADPVRDGVAVPDHTADNEPTRGRKRKRQSNLWKRNIRKQSRSAGTEYVTRKGKLVSERKPLVAKCFRTGCRLKCAHNFTDLLNFLFSTICDMGGLIQN